MPNPKKPGAPRGLGPAGRKVWRDHVTKYAFSPAELELLGEAAREKDLLVRLQAAVDSLIEYGSDETANLTTTGSMGQLVAHPLLGELRQHRSTYRQLLVALNLPEEEGESRSAAGRALASARWAS